MGATAEGKLLFLLILISRQSSEDRIFGLNGMMLAHDDIIQSLENMPSFEGAVAFFNNFKDLCSFYIFEYPQRCCPQHSRCCSPQALDQGKLGIISWVAGGKSSARGNLTDRKMRSAALEC